MPLKKLRFIVFHILIAGAVLFQSCNGKCDGADTIITTTGINMISEDSVDLNHYDATILGVRAITSKRNGDRHCRILTEVIYEENRIMNNTVKIYCSSPLVFKGKTINANDNLLNYPHDFQIDHYKASNTYFEQCYLLTISNNIDTTFKNGRYMFYVTTTSENGNAYTDSSSVFLYRLP